jgi:hypothetical protein
MSWPTGVWAIQLQPRRRVKLKRKRHLGGPQSRAMTMDMKKPAGKPAGFFV